MVGASGAALWLELPAVWRWFAQSTVDLLLLCVSDVGDMPAVDGEAGITKSKAKCALSSFPRAPLRHAKKAILVLAVAVRSTPLPWREPRRGSCLWPLWQALRPPSFCSPGCPLLYRRRSDRRKRTRALHGGPPADIGDTGSGPVPPAAPSSVAGLASVCLSVPTPLEPGPSLDPPSWWAYEGSEATPVAYPLPHSIHDGCPFDAPEGYAPSCLVLEELVSFGAAPQGSRSVLAGALSLWRFLLLCAA